MTGCKEYCPLHDNVLVEAERRRELYELRQSLLQQLQGPDAEQWPAIQRQIRQIEQRLVEQTRRVINLSKIYELGCYLCLPGGMLW